MAKNDVYSELAKKLGAPVSKRFLAILDAMFTPEEAGICLGLFAPSTKPELAKKLKVDEKTLAKTLQSLVDRGILTRGKTQYAFHTSLVAFHHDFSDAGVFTGPNAMSQKVKDLWEDFFRNEWADIMLDGFVKMSEHVPVQIWPAIGALELSPDIRPEDILPEENWKLAIEKAKRRIFAPCGCRVMWGHCNHPVMTCLACFDNDRGAYYLNKPGRLLKEVSLEESMNIVREAEKSGLVHSGVCYCCKDECEWLFPAARADKFDFVAPNRYLAVVNEDICKGCKQCVTRCPFKAIEMKKSANSNKLKASISKEKCKGCGVCIVGCKQKALRYEIVRPPEYITGKLKHSLTPAGNYWGFYDLK